jgi:hypothetical protein
MCVAAAGQEYPAPSHQLTSSNPSARYEIVQSPLAARWTFRLDRFTGKVWQNVKTADGGSAWEEMLVIGLPWVPPMSPPKYQLFSSGIAARFTFLINTDTGKTWELATSKKRNKDGTEYDQIVWQPLSE